MRISAPSSRVQSTSSGFRICTSPTVLMSPAVTAPGPVLRSVMRFAPSLCILIAIVFTLRTISVTSSRTPGIDENSCSTPSICTEVTAAPWSDDRRTRRSALPSVVPKPRSNGSATTVAIRLGSSPGATSSLFGLMSSCQFFWITFVPFWGKGEWQLASGEWISTPPTSATRHSPFANSLDAAALAGPAAVVRDRRDVADRSDREPRRLEGAKRRLAARPGTRHLDLQRAHAVLGRFAGSILRGHLGRIGSRLARPFEAHRTGGRPRDRVALGVRDGNHGVVERGVHMRHAGDNVLAFAAADAGRFFGHSLVLQARPLCKALGIGVQIVVAWLGPGHLFWMRRAVWRFPGQASMNGPARFITSSCRRSASICPSGCGRSYACADREPAGCGGDAGRDTRRGPSGA